MGVPTYTVQHTPCWVTVHWESGWCNLPMHPCLLQFNLHGFRCIIGLLGNVLTCGTIDNLGSKVNYFPLCTVYKENISNWWCYSKSKDKVVAQRMLGTNI